MRKIIFTRGLPGSGKSTVVKSLGLEDYVLSKDDLRLIFSSPTLNAEGKMGINQANNPQVYKEFKRIMHNRMRNGDFLVVDTTMLRGEEIKENLKIASKYFYDVAILDFSSLPIEVVKERNWGRSDIRRVPEYVIDDFYEFIDKSSQLLSRYSNVNIIDGTQDISIVKSNIDGFLHTPIRDFNHYEKVIHIGDLQGCLTPLIDGNGIIKDGFNDKYAYIFTGDLLDRGIENGKLLKYLINKTQGKSNIYFLRGNHETHLMNYVNDDLIESKVFLNETLPQIVEENISKEKIYKFLKSFDDILLYTKGGINVCVTHAGLPIVPKAEDAFKISGRQYLYGTGSYQDPVDKRFEQNSPSNWYQVHGHRNYHNEDVQNTSKTFNLEGSVEWGGELRSLIFDGNNFEIHKNYNNVFKPLRERGKKFMPGTKEMGGDIVLSQLPAPWIEKPSDIYISENTLNLMKNHSGVRVRAFEDYPHISSFNFTRDVFFNSSWDEVTTKARGLFINHETNEVVARGYEKFFNLGERKDTELASLKESLRFPVKAYIKENGYLGLLGFDSQTNQLFLSTKSTPGGDFSNNFREVFNKLVPVGKQEGLRRWLRDNEACMAFEVIDPIFDPHMIEYQSSRLVLLDIFKRSENTEKMTFEHMQAVASRFGLESKKQAMVFNNYEQLEGWYKKLNGDLNFKISGKDVEGIVLEDKSGFQTKVKFPFYSFWKKMRAEKDRIAKYMECLADGMDKGGDLRKVKENFNANLRKTLNNNAHELAHEFIDYIVQLDAKTIKNSSIIELRNGFYLYLNENQIQLEPLMSKKWLQYKNEASIDDGKEDDISIEATQVNGCKKLRLGS